MRKERSVLVTNRKTDGEVYNSESSGPETVQKVHKER